MKNTIGFFTALMVLAVAGANAATIKGTVDSGGTARAAGTPLAGAKVVLLGLNIGGGGTAKRLDSTTTDAKGQYTFAKADSGIIEVQASMTGYQNGTGIAFVRSDTVTYTVNVSLAEIAKPGAIKGTVHIGTDSGAPLANALVVITRNFGGGGGARNDSVRTDAKGQFAFDSLTAATYVIRVTATGYTNGNVDATVGSGATITSNVVMLPIGASGKIAGKVTKASGGGAVANAAVILTRNGARGGDTVMTDAQGMYGYDSVAIGTAYTLAVKAAGLQSALEADIGVTYAKTTTVDFALLALPADSTHGSITGLVADEANKPLAKARVILARKGGGGAAVADTVETDANGMFTVPSAAQGNNYRLTVSLTGYTTATRTGLGILAGETLISNFILAQAASIQTAAVPRSGMRLTFSGNYLLLNLPESAASGWVRLFDANGAMSFTATVPAQASQLALPAGKRSGYLVLKRGASLERMALPVGR